MEILKKFAMDRSVFTQETPLLDYALAVEKITTAKVRIEGGGGTVEGVIDVSCLLDLVIILYEEGISAPVS